MPAAQGRFRRAVDLAWQSAAEADGSDSSDRSAKDAWYRRQLDTIASVSSTRGFTPAAILDLAGAFDQLARVSPPPATRSSLHSPPDTRHPTPSPRHALRDTLPPTPDTLSPPLVPGLSPAQQDAFQRLATRAWQTMLQRDQAPSAGFLAWINARIGEATNVSSGRRSGQVKFDQLMCMLAIVANDAYWTDRTSQSAETRMRHRIRQQLDKLGKLQGRTLDWSYAQGICQQARLASSIDDCPAQSLRAILAMLVYAARRKAASLS